MAGPFPAGQTEQLDQPGFPSDLPTAHSDGTGPLRELPTRQFCLRTMTGSKLSARSRGTAIYSRLGSQLRTVRCLGEPVDLETVTFVARVGLRVRHGLR